MPEQTEQLTTAIASGDAEAFARFYEAWFDVAYREARRVTRRDESFALDVVQNTMIKTYKSIPTLNSEAELAAWLRKVVRSCAYDLLRKETAARKREEKRGHKNVPSSHAAPAEEQLAWLADEMQRLDDRYRKPLLMRFRFGWTLAQIGAALGLSTGAADGRIARGLDLLRDASTERQDD